MEKQKGGCPGNQGNHPVSAPGILGHSSTAKCFDDLGQFTDGISVDMRRHKKNEYAVVGVVQSTR